MLAWFKYAADGKLRFSQLASITNAGADCSNMMHMRYQA